MIVIAGYGYVGKAHYDVFKNEAIVVDPKYNDGKISDFPAAKGVICCVSTPSLPDGSCDATNVIDVIRETPENVPILIKSTFDLQSWEYIKNCFPNHIINYSPEFLRAANATSDMKYLDHLIISRGAGEEFWKIFYSKFYNDIDFYTCSVEEAIAIKYFKNAFFATKVSFFNEIYDFCEQYNIDFETVRVGMARDWRINGDHSIVNPVDGIRGWGGHCLPKDTSALLKMAELTNKNLNTLDAAVRYNASIRKNT